MIVQGGKKTLEYDTHCLIETTCSNSEFFILYVDLNGCHGATDAYIKIFRHFHHTLKLLTKGAFHL
jgi:hypothetical protein